MNFFGLLFPIIFLPCPQVKAHQPVIITLDASPRRQETLSTVDPLPMGSKVLVVGDSLAVGMGPTLRERGRFGGYRVTVEAERGSRVDQWSRRIEKIMNDRSPDIVVVVLGTNDSFLDRPENQLTPTKKLISEITVRGSRLVWVLPPPLPSRAAGRSQIIDIVKKEVEAAGAITMDSSAITFDRERDGVHFSPTGYAKWSSKVWDFLKSKGFIS